MEVGGGINKVNPLVSVHGTVKLEDWTSSFHRQLLAAFISLTLMPDFGPNYTKTL